MYTYIHTYIQTDRQTDRHTDRQTDRRTHTHTACQAEDPEPPTQPYYLPERQVECEAVGVAGEGSPQKKSRSGGFPRGFKYPTIPGAPNSPKWVLS